jgi:hydrogenase-4 component H
MREEKTNMFFWVRKGLRTGVLTTRYPGRYELMPPDFRGRPVIDPDHCLAAQGCTACIDVCLPKALHVDQVGNEQNKMNSLDERLTLDLGRCIMCGLCINACPADALYMTQEYELAVTYREALQVVASFTKDTDSPTTMGERGERHESAC